MRILGVGCGCGNFFAACKIFPLKLYEIIQNIPEEEYESKSIDKEGLKC